MLAERAEMLVRLPAVENAELFDELIGDAAREPLQRAVRNGFGQPLENEEPPAGLARHIGLEPPRGALALRRRRRSRR